MLTQDMSEKSTKQIKLPGNLDKKLTIYWLPLEPENPWKMKVSNPQYTGNLPLKMKVVSSHGGANHDQQMCKKMAIFFPTKQILRN